MKKKIWLIEDFPKVEYHDGKYYAYNSETGEGAIFNNEKQLLFYKRFSPGGKIDPYATSRNNLHFLRWDHDDLLSIGWIDATTYKPLKFGLYNIKTKSYVLPVNNYIISYYSSECEGGGAAFFKTEKSLFVIDFDGNLIGKLCNNTFCKNFNRDRYNFESKSVILVNSYGVGVYSFKENRIIVPVEFDKIRHDKLTEGFIVTKNKQMGIYSYEGEILTELDSHYIEPLCEEYKKSSIVKKLVKITDKSNNVGLYTLDHQCIIPNEYKNVYYHSDKFIIVQNHNLSWTVYSLPKREFLVPPSLGVIINYSRKNGSITIHATKYMQLEGHGGYNKTIHDSCFVHKGVGVVEEDNSYTKFISAKYKYIICYDVYSIDGELIRENVIDTIGKSTFCNPFLDPCIPFS